MINYQYIVPYVIPWETHSTKAAIAQAKEGITVNIGGNDTRGGLSAENWLLLVSGAITADLRI